MKSSNPESFHDMDAKKGMRKEITGYSGYTDTRNHAEYKKPWTKSQVSRTGSYARKLVPGASQEYRVLRDCRMIQKANVDVVQESLQNSSIDNHQVTSSVIDKSSGGDLIDQQQSGSRNSDSHIQSQDLERQGGSCPSHGIYTEPSGNDGPSLPEEKHITPLSSTLIVAGEVVDNSQAHCASSASANSVSSSSDPIHVPSAGTVGIIRREVGVVGGRRKPSDFITVHASLSSNSFANPRVVKRASSSIETFGQSATAFKSSYANSFSTSDHSLQNVSVNKSFAAHQYNVRPQQLVSHQKVKHSTVEWKPKPAKKPNPNSPGEIGTTLVTSSCVHSSTNSSNVQIDGLSEKILQVNISNDDQVIIPHHLQVSLSEQTGLTFGSFEAVFDSTKGIVSASQAFVTVEESDHQTSSSIPSSVPVGSNKEPAAVQSDSMNSVARITSYSPTSAPEHDHTLTVNSESVSLRDIESYPDIGLVQSHNPPYISSKPHQLHNPANLQSFSVQEYEPQMRFGTPFSGTIVDVNAERPGLSSASQAFNSHVASGTLVSSIPIIQQQQQQQPLTQFYPQVHMSHYPNFFSYCPIYSPVYAPPMAMPNYANNPTYPHPSNGSNYLVMPTGNSNLASSGMNYTASQYKPVHSGSPTTGFGNYTNPGGYTGGTPRAIGTTAGFEDVGRIKYKDNNLYVQGLQAPQAEAPPDIWIRNPTELANLQSPPYYSLPGQAVAAPSSAHPAFLPGAHAVHSSFGSAASHVQYANAYHHPPQLPGHHHMVHQQAGLGLGATNAGVGGAANAQVGPYRQNQNGHFGWANNF